jgi:chemotaxis protein MotB
MAKKKCKCPPPGAPEWVVTYGDMMSLLLTFFILLASLSEIKKEDEYQAIVAEVKKAFGLSGGGGPMPSTMDPQTSLIQRLEEMELRHKKSDYEGSADDPGIDGKEVTVTNVRQGLRYVVGGVITFEPGSAELTNEARAALKHAAELIRGYNNIVELSGHAGSMEVVSGSDYPDLDTLSYARAKAAADYLASDEVRIRRERLRLVASAQYEPLEPRAYDFVTQTPNRRVEVVVTESLMQDKKGP